VSQDWTEVTVRMPKRFTATPQEILEFLREYFAEDQVLGFLWSVGDAAVHQAAEELRGRSSDISFQGYIDHDPEYEARSEEWSEAADEIDPAEGGGHYPSRMLCFRHGEIGPVKALPCPGTPECGPAKWKEGT
jgi:hypothetical protein